MREVEDGPALRVLLRLPASFDATGEVNTARAIVLLEPWDERDESSAAVAARVREHVEALPGVQVATATPPSLGLQGNLRPIAMVLGGPDYEQLAEWRDRMLAAMREMPELRDPDSNYQQRKPQMKVRVDRDRAAALGVSLASIGQTLETMLGSRIVTTFVDRGREYDVILQGQVADRASPDDLDNLYVRSTSSGGLVALANLASFGEEAGPDQLARFDRMRAITLEADLAPGVRLGSAIEALEAAAQRALPPSARIDWDGEAREFRESGSSLLFTFGLALVIVFLVLAAQFESFVHPLLILLTVPLALTGALLGLWLYGASINVFSQIGTILLIGLAAKNGVLIVEFANQLRDRGLAFEEALLEGAAIRLRPIVMTSGATILGAVPLLLASGAGAESRQPIGIVVVFGVALSALLTLFVVPAAYAAFARGVGTPEAVSRRIEALRGGGVPEAG